MTAVILQVIADPMSLNIDENTLRVAASSEIGCVNFSFEVDGKLCGITLKKEDFYQIVKFLEKQFNGDF